MDSKPVLEIDGLGTKTWKLNGKIHNEDGPAIEFVNGTKQWWINDLLHREGLPAVEWADGGTSWLINGKYHRVNGPAEMDDNYKEWWFNDEKLYNDYFLREFYQESLISGYSIIGLGN